MRASPTDAVREHYDRLDALYRAYWGEHVHHGLFREPGIGRAEAQEALIEELARFARVRDGSSVLDVGCGRGGTCIHLAERHGCRCEGITISGVQASAARRRARRVVAALRPTFRVHDASDLGPFLAEGRRFDVVWCVECSEHVADKARLLAESAALLAPGGRVAICAWCEPDHLVDAERRRDLAPILEGMLVPSLWSAERYRLALAGLGLADVRSVDLTEEVRPTWDLCAAILEVPAVRLVLRTAGRRVRAFAASFRAMRGAYANGSLRYAAIAAEKG